MSNPPDYSDTALLVIDVQDAFQERDGRNEVRSNPAAENNIALLLEQFRQNKASVIHVHHHSLESDSLFRADLPGARVQDFAKPLDGEQVYVKNVNSGFIGTTLESDLRRDGYDNLVLCGATANHCVETTTRMAGNLGFNCWYIADGVWAYGDTGPDGVEHTAEQVHSMSLSNLHGEFATVLLTASILELLS